MNEGISQEVQQLKQRFSIIGSAPALIYAINRARVVAPFDQSVLITGESGVGKESFPKIIHNYSQSVDSPFHQILKKSTYYIKS